MSKLQCWKNLDHGQPVTLRGDTPDDVLLNLRSYVMYLFDLADGLVIGDFYAINGECVPNEFEAYSLAYDPRSDTWDIHCWVENEYVENQVGLSLKEAAEAFADLAVQYVL